MSQSPTGTIITPDNSVVGAASSTDNAIVRFDGTNGKLIQNSGVTIADGVSGAFVGTFATIAVSGQSDVVADTASDTLTLVASSNMTITTTAASDTVTIAASGIKLGGVKAKSNTSASTPSDTAGTATDITLNNSGAEKNTLQTGSASGFSIASAVRPTISFDQSGSVHVVGTASTSGASTSPPYILFLYIGGVEVDRKPFQNIASYLDPVTVASVYSYTSGQEIKLMCAQTGGGAVKTSVFTDVSIAVTFVKDN